jgi:putative addiction module component (TIGR02574 family)
MDLQTVLTEVDSWPVEDRLRLLEEVWDRLIDQGYEPDVTEELKAELDRRLDALDKNPDAVVPWEVVEARALERFRNGCNGGGVSLLGKPSVTPAENSGQNWGRR